MIEMYKIIKGKYDKDVITLVKTAEELQYIHRTAALSFICVVMKARGWNST
jgi:hypothetical protein